MRASLITMVLIWLVASCLNRQFVGGRAELISVSDSTLNGSAIIVGHVYRGFGYNVAGMGAQVWIDGAGGMATADLTGNFELGLQPGTHTLKCQSGGNPWPQLIEEIKDLSVEPNKKVRVNFYLGSTIE